MILDMPDPYLKIITSVEPWCTGNTARIVFLPGTLSINGDLLTVGDQIGVFTETGMCVGAAKLEEEAIEKVDLIIWGDDSVSPEKDGLVEGEKIHIRFWDYDASKEYYADAYYKSGEVLYNEFDVLYVDSLVVYGTADIETDNLPKGFSLSQNYPQSVQSCYLYFVYHSAGKLCNPECI